MTQATFNKIRFIVNAGQGAIPADAWEKHKAMLRKEAKKLDGAVMATIATWQLDARILNGSLPSQVRYAASLIYQHVKGQFMAC